MKCERCNIEHDGSYASGRFCSEKCSRNRPITEEIRNKIRDSKLGKTLSEFHRKQISKSLSGKKYPGRRNKMSDEEKIAKHYKISVEEYRSLVNHHNGKCRLCGRGNSQSGKSIRLCVDHNHKTGKVRGLLCNQCNHAIGLFQDNPKLLRKAADYLEELIYDLTEI